MTTVLGKDAKLYRNSGDYENEVWVEVDNVKDLTLTLEKGEADVTTRASGGWRETAATLKDGSVEFGMVYDPADANFTSFQTAFLTDGQLELAIVDGDITTAGTQGLRASFEIFNFGQEQNLEEAVMVNVTIKPGRSAHAPEWMMVT